MGTAAGRQENLDLSAELGGETLLFHVFDGGFAPEQVDSGTWREEPLMLLPLQGLKNRTVRRWTESQPRNAS